jgi:hypothetical protein
LVPSLCYSWCLVFENLDLQEDLLNGAAAGSALGHSACPSFLHLYRGFPCPPSTSSLRYLGWGDTPSTCRLILFMGYQHKGVPVKENDKNIYYIFRLPFYRSFISKKERKFIGKSELIASS